MVVAAPTPLITWDKLPDDFVLPDDPVDNINQPAIAAALTDALQGAGRLPATALTPTNYSICARLDGRVRTQSAGLGLYSPHHCAPC